MAEHLDSEPAASTEAPYDVAEAAPGYSNVTGLVSTFAFAAVVLVFLIAATAAKSPNAQQNVDMGFATILFSIGFLGCLIGAFAFASLGGAPNTRALVTNSMLVASVVAICLVAVLGGFEALATAFLPRAAAAFAVIAAAVGFLAPVLVWFPLYDVEFGFDDAGLPKPMVVGAGRPPRERVVVGRLAGLAGLGLVTASVGVSLHFTHVFRPPTTAEYYVLGFCGLAYTAAVVVGALLISREPGSRLSPLSIWIVNTVQCLFVCALISVLP